MTKKANDPRVEIVVRVMENARFERLRRMLEVGDMRRNDGRVRMAEEAQAIIAALDARDIALFDDATDRAKAMLAALEPQPAQVEAEARRICFAMCRTGQFLDHENGCCSICKSESECQSWRCFDSPARAALATPQTGVKP